MEATSTRKPSGRGAKTTWAQSQAMVEWLEMPPGNNFKIINGKGSEVVGSVIPGVKITKAAGYKDIADYVNEKCGTKWTQKEGESRFTSFLAKYKAVKNELIDNSGAKFCLTDEEAAQGVTIQGKLELACPSFARMDALYSERANVNAPVVVDSGPGGRDDLADDDEDGSEDGSGFFVLEHLSNPSISLSVAMQEAAVESPIPAPTTTPSAVQLSTAQVTAPKPVSKKMERLIALSKEAKEGAIVDGGKSSDQKKKRDFTTCYAETKQMDIEVKREMIAVDSEYKSEELALKRQQFESDERRHQEERNDKKDQRRMNFIVELAKSGKSKAEIEEMLELFS